MKSRLTEVQPCGQSQGSIAERHCFNPISQLHEPCPGNSQRPSCARAAWHPGPSLACAQPAASTSVHQPCRRRRESQATRPRRCWQSSGVPAFPPTAPGRMVGRRLGSGLCPGPMPRTCPSTHPSGPQPSPRYMSRGERGLCGGADGVLVNPRAAPAAEGLRHGAARLPGPPLPPPTPTARSSRPVCFLSPAALHVPTGNLHVPHQPRGGQGAQLGAMHIAMLWVKVFQTASLAET